MTREICVIGGGNIGVALCYYLSRSKNITVHLYTSHPNSFKRELKYVDTASGIVSDFTIDSISDSIVESVSNVEIVFLTVPSFARPKFLDQLANLLKPGNVVCSVPGYGGTEFAAKRLLDSGVVFAGMDRVPAIARLLPEGVHAGKKGMVGCAALPSSQSNMLAERITELLGLSCYPLPNYLTVTLTPSNPLLHTTRLFSLFKDWNEGTFLSANVPFYESWTDETSELLLRCDDELQQICAALSSYDLCKVIPLRKHYESKTTSKLTQKIRSINAFKGIMSPMIFCEEGYIPDLQSRYFQEDFAFGLCVLKGFGLLSNTRTPSMDTVLKWYQKLSGKTFFYSDRVGPHIAETSAPQAFGINTVADINSYYKVTSAISI